LFTTAVKAVPRAATANGSSDNACGMGAGPSGLPMETDFNPRSTAGLLAARALLPAPWSMPPSIHFRIVRMSRSASFEFGGIAGSSVCVIDLNN
jgi:hypothetical protein